MSELVSLTGNTSAKFDQHIGRKGYKAPHWGNSPDSTVYVYYDKKNGPQEEMCIVKCNEPNKTRVRFQTPHEEEFKRLETGLQSEGYLYTEKDQVGLYQKGLLCVHTWKKAEGDKTTYFFEVEKKTLPKARDIVYAEDLLSLSSHEYLAAVYGDANVKKDFFYFSDEEVNKCSVLFPNTPMQVIFIWKDEASRRDIDFILLGGQLRAQSSAGYDRPVVQNTWQSKQGIQSGMSLKELYGLNDNDIQIYSWGSDRPGVVDATTKGNLNFKKLSLVLNCFDCNDDKLSAATSLKASNLINEGRRVFVSTIVLMPEK